MLITKLCGWWKRLFLARCQAWRGVAPIFNILPLILRGRFVCQSIWSASVRCRNWSDKVQNGSLPGSAIRIRETPARNARLIVNFSGRTIESQKQMSDPINMSTEVKSFMEMPLKSACRLSIRTLFRSAWRSTYGNTSGSMSTPVMLAFNDRAQKIPARHQPHPISMTFKPLTGRFRLRKSINNQLEVQVLLPYRSGEWIRFNCLTFGWFESSAVIPKAETEFFIFPTDLLQGQRTCFEFPRPWSMLDH